MSNLEENKNNKVDFLSIYLYAIHSDEIPEIKKKINTKNIKEKLRNRSKLLENHNPYRDPMQEA